MTDDLTIGAVGQEQVRNRPTVKLQSLRSGVWLPVGVVVGLGVFFAITTPSFLTLRNASGILGQASTLLLACLGASFVVLMGSIDLSVGAMVLLTGAVTVTALNAAGIGVFALPLAVVIGTGLGFANGAIFAFGRIPSFVVTLGTLSILYPQPVGSSSKAAPCVQFRDIRESGYRPTRSVGAEHRFVRSHRLGRDGACRGANAFRPLHVHYRRGRGGRSNGRNAESDVIKSTLSLFRVRWRVSLARWRRRAQSRWPDARPGSVASIRLRQSWSAEPRFRAGRAACIAP